MRSERGFTLVELLVVIAVLGILIGVVAFASNAVMDIAARRADAASVRVLNAATLMLSMLESKPVDVVFPESSTDSEKLQHLVESDMLESYPRVAQRGRSFVWEPTNPDAYPDGEAMWLWRVDTVLNYFTFNGQQLRSMDDLWSQGFIRGHVGGWQLNRVGALTSSVIGESLLYRENDYKDYRITATAALNDGPGYGILFDAWRGDNGRDNGYILQYESTHGGRIIIRPRVNGHERVNSAALNSQPWLRAAIGASDLDHIDGGGSRSPILYTYVLTDAQKASLNSGNRITMEVQGVEPNRTMRVFLGDEELFDWGVPVGSQPGTHTGFRTWLDGNRPTKLGSRVTFHELSVQGL